MQAQCRLRERRACGLVGLGRSTCRYQARRADWPALRERLRALAAERRRVGYRRLSVLLRREGDRVNRKRVDRLYRREGLAVRRRARRRRIPRGTSLVGPTRITERWALDVVLDTLEDGRRVRLLTVVDDVTLACLAIEVDTSIGGHRVVQVLQRLVETRGTPAVLNMTMGPSASAGPSTPGRTRKAFGCTVSIPARRTSMRSSGASTAGSVTRVSPNTGSSVCPTRARSSRPGGWTTMPFDPTAPWGTCHPRSSSRALLTERPGPFSHPDWSRVG